MNTSELKKYAPKARLAFMEAVTKRAAFLGLYADRIAEMTIDGDSAVIEGRVFTRQQGQQRTQLVKRIEALGTNNGKFVLKDGFNQFINETAFTWFNRLTAIRYMEVNEYLDHGYRVLSNGENAQFGEGFEILGSAADVADDLGLNKESIIDMVLDGNKEEELYRAILLGQCHQLSEAMPFMFEALDDATELLLPDNLTKTDSILKDLVNDIPEDNWQEIEVIGWLYQFYISEHKEAVIGKVVKREDIPAATQLFTPNWIVKYLVQNSLGRQWLATYPDSELKEKMEYYITPAEQSDDVIEQLKAITPTSIDPEEIKVLDPACGSGHILVEVYEVLREIYLERGYRPREIPELILTKNIYGLDIDDRAAQMAAFAVMMKAREDDKRIFSRDIKLNIHSIQSTENLNINQLWADLDLDGNKQAGSMGDLFAEPQLEISEVSAENKVYLDLLRYLKEQFIDAKNLGSLIDINDQRLKSLFELKEKLAINKTQAANPTVQQTATALLTLVQPAILLATKYDSVIANPPYMGAKWMNSKVKAHIKTSYVNSKADLYAAFIELYKNRVVKNGRIAIVAMESWMFLPTFEEFRAQLLTNLTLTSLVHMPYEGKGTTSMGINFGTAAFVAEYLDITNYITSYQCIRSNEIDSKGKPITFPTPNEKSSLRSKSEFKGISGQPIAYWATQETISSFRYIDGFKSIKSQATARKGLATGDNERFIRNWQEVNFDLISTSGEENTWAKCNNGGDFRKWYGNQESVIYWKNDGYDIRNFKDDKGKLRSRPQGLDRKFEPMISWTSASSSFLGVRYYEAGFISDQNGNFLISEFNSELRLLAFLCSPVAKYLTDLLNPTKHILVGNINDLPLPKSFSHNSKIEDLASRAIEISKTDWDWFETSFNFKKHPLLNNSNNILDAYSHMHNLSLDNTNELLSIERFIEQQAAKEFGLQPKLIELSDITLKMNSKFMFKSKNISEQEEKLQSKLFSEFMSYFFGCIMGRYSLDREGLVYAHSGNKGFKELVAEGAYKTLPADDDGIVPLADEEWLFDDDATTRFREFVKTVWGEEHLQENLDFVAESLCLDAIKAKKGESSMDTIRRYFSTQFFKDHLKTYKKRPIYWLFSSGKEKAFECLVYLHRYNESTLSRMRTEYVTPLMGKLESRKNILDDSKATATGAELRAIDKELKTIDKKQAELVKFDEELKHLAEMKISIDLDDGVKVNYGKFGNLLADVKAIHGKAPEKIK
ncbi:BREX-1 system adenine-specific DNA-methyltransferase PglX [Photobacterium leiognathi subsp. mandapamensis]|uniref:BREX-1 system adenine-specific DNA-methyltransferase PglX n=1 Tax=Photobacterium leiognathi TaxID=553611 RepID=UPI003BF598D5